MAALQARNYEKYSEPVPTLRCIPVIKPKTTIAAILKPSTYDVLMYECGIINLTKANYKNVLEERTVDLLLVDAIPAEPGDLSLLILESLILCSKKGIYAVFWDTDEKELSGKSLELVSQFDAVFTVKSRMVDEYKKLLMIEDVYFLPFAVQPRIHHPIEKNRVNKEDLVSVNSRLVPERLPGTTSKILSLKYKEDSLNQLHYAPKEIFELLGCGMPLISGYSEPVAEIFFDTVKLYRTDSEFSELSKQLTEDKDAADKLSVIGQRLVLGSHTYTDRIDAILRTIGLSDGPAKLPGVTMVSSTNKLDSMDNIFRNYALQKYANKELIIILNNNRLDLGQWRSRAEEFKNVKVFQLDESQPLGRCLNLALDSSDFPFVSKCDDDNYYGPDFISDLMNVYKYADAEIVGKLTYYCYLEGCRVLAMMCPQMEYRYVNMISGSALIIRREVFEKVRFSDKRQGSDTVFLKECIKQGVRMFSADRFNYVYKRHASLADHTWKMPDEIFLRSCKVVDITDDYEPRVTV